MPRQTLDDPRAASVGPYSHAVWAGELARRLSQLAERFASSSSWSRR